MSVEEYLKDKLTNCSKADLRPVDQEFLDENGVEAFIFRMLMSKKFRKWKVDEEYKQQIKEAIRFNMKKQQPIELAFFFGGYKLWQLSSAPEVNWAEFFTLTFFSNYIAPILATYDHGVKIKFWAAHPSIMARQSNIPEDDCRKYFKSFESLIGELEKNFPANYKIEIHSIAELYPDEAEYKSELKTLIEQTDNKYKEEYDQEKIDKKLASSEMNIQWQGAEDWASLNAEERQ
ncbi:hypothetical protein KKB40_00800 [Patescibacteria group bacterium]|nr:hypothetical protein [Patescibacteria group bacterium]